MLADQVDRIIHQILASLPPGELTFDDARRPGQVAYTLRIRQVKVGLIQVESALPGALITFSIVQNDFTLTQAGQEFTFEIENLAEVIMAAIKAETSQRRWKEITPASSTPPQPESHPISQPPFIVQKTYADLAYRLHRRRPPWEKIPNHAWDRRAVKFWCDGLTHRQIAELVNVQPRTVSNRLSKLRTCYPLAGIPTRQQRIKHLTQDETE